MPVVGNFSVLGPNADKGNKKRQRNPTATSAQMGEGSRGLGGPGKVCALSYYGIPLHHAIAVQC